MAGIATRMLYRLGFMRRPDLVVHVQPTHPTPEQLQPGRLIVVRDGGFEKAACFRCPGGCGEKIVLNLSPRRSPKWTVKWDGRFRATVLPSVRQLNECRCHFWIRNGEIDWCFDTPSSKIETYEVAKVDRVLTEESARRVNIGIAIAAGAVALAILIFYI